VFMNYPLPTHLHAALAAEAALAAGAQGKFWEMHDLLLANQEALEGPALEGYAKSLGLDMARFRRDLEGHAYAARIAQERKIADGFGLKGTPTFLFNGRIVRGALDVKDLRTIVDEELARAGK
jgi:protein-disulfide isomerase